MIFRKENPTNNSWIRSPTFFPVRTTLRCREIFFNSTSVLRRFHRQISTIKNVSEITGNFYNDEKRIWCVVKKFKKSPSIRNRHWGKKWVRWTKCHSLGQEIMALPFFMQLVVEKKNNNVDMKSGIERWNSANFGATVTFYWDSNPFGMKVLIKIFFRNVKLAASCWGEKSLCG